DLGDGIEGEGEEKRAGFDDRDGPGPNVLLDHLDEMFIGSLLPGDGVEEFVGGGQVDDGGNGHALEGSLGQSQIEIAERLDVWNAFLAGVFEGLLFTGNLEGEEGDRDDQAEQDEAEQDLFVMFFYKIHLTGKSFEGRRARCSGLLVPVL